MNQYTNPHYLREEERLNIITHAIGLLLALIAFPFLIYKALNYTDLWEMSSFVVYGISLIILYAASTFYHAATHPKLRRRLNIFDHAAIYILIAGSYTPFCLVALQSVLGWYMFIFVWIFGLSGVILKLFFTGKFDKISTALYLLMGWQVIFFIKPLIASVSDLGLYALISGGVFYTIGAVFYSVGKIKFNHAIFHVFVLLGSLSHFIAIMTL